MPSNHPINRSLNLLYRPFLIRLQDGLATARDMGHDVYLFEGWRSLDRQAWLYSSGRDREGPIRTWTTTGMHPLGLAGDVAFGGPKKWHWRGDWDAVGGIMERAGLEWLGRTTADKAHFQLLEAPVLSVLNRIYRESGLVGVWLEMDRILEKRHANLAKDHSR